MAPRLSFYNMVTDDLDEVPLLVDKELRIFSLSSYFAKQSGSVPSELVIKFQQAAKEEDPVGAIHLLADDLGNKKGRKKKEKEDTLSTNDVVENLNRVIKASFFYHEELQVPPKIGCNFVNFEFTQNSLQADSLFANVADTGWRFRQVVLPKLFFFQV